jgi:outer membrane lipoprotein SlyB
MDVYRKRRLGKRCGCRKVLRWGTVRRGVVLLSVRNVSVETEHTGPANDIKGMVLGWKVKGRVYDKDSGWRWWLETAANAGDSGEGLLAGNHSR